MAETAEVPSPAMSVAEEEAAFYHEAGLNATWTGTRIAMGSLSLLFGSFIFAFFYLRSLNSYHLWYPAQINGVAFHGPGRALGIAILACVVVSALVQTLVLQQIKNGRKKAWSAGALIALVLGLAAVGLQIYQLANLSFWPGSSGFASVFVGFCPVFLTLVFLVMVWLETLLMRARHIPEISFVEQPPTYAEAFAVQRFQAGLSSFTVIWNYLAVVAVVAWILFYLVH
jgi:heme/copper-type cytochrome/quinol oxidase subunit 3